MTKYGVVMSRLNWDDLWLQIDATSEDLARSEAVRLHPEWSVAKCEVMP